MGTCSVCKKHLGLLNREFCCCVCGEIICRECRNRIPNDDDKTMDSLVLAHAIRNHFSRWDGSFSVCPSCHEKFKSLYSKMKNSIIMCDSYPSIVRIYTSNYQGRVPKGDFRCKIESGWFRDRNESINQLKAMAAFLDCKSVVEVRFNKDTASEPSENGKGTHYYTIWSVTGYAMK